MVKDHSDSERGNPLPPHRLLFPINSKGSFICTIPTDRITHTTAFVTPVMEHWLEREIFCESNKSPQYYNVYSILLLVTVTGHKVWATWPVLNSRSYFSCFTFIFRRITNNTILKAGVLVWALFYDLKVKSMIMPLIQRITNLPSTNPFATVAEKRSKKIHITQAYTTIIFP